MCSLGAEWSTNHGDCQRDLGGWFCIGVVGRLQFLFLNMRPYKEAQRHRPTSYSHLHSEPEQVMLKVWWWRPRGVTLLSGSVDATKRLYFVCCRRSYKDSISNTSKRTFSTPSGKGEHVLMGDARPFTLALPRFPSLSLFTPSSLPSPSVGFYFFCRVVCSSVTWFVATTIKQSPVATWRA